MTSGSLVLRTLLPLAAMLLGYGNSAAQEASTTVPIFRLAQGHNFFLTTDCGEKQKAANGGFIPQGVLGYAPSTPGPGRQQLYRFSMSGSNHLYTLSENEGRSAGFRLEPFGVYLYINNAPNRLPVYRLAKGSDHLYTTYDGEYSRALTEGWRSEGILGYIESKQDDPCPVAVSGWTITCSCNVETSSYSCHGSRTLTAPTAEEAINRCSDITHGRGTYTRPERTP
jgi:hypothetical protein